MVDIRKIDGTGIIQPGKSRANKSNGNVDYDSLINANAGKAKNGVEVNRTAGQSTPVGLDPRFAGMKIDPRIAFRDEISLVMNASPANGSSEISGDSARIDRIEKLKAMIQNGTYDISPEKVADRILKRGTFL
ncbi:MAG: hypothetical protein CVV64_07205 [Candidatus Wallbacteria bacterium HGW-Wallbacteria-1]|jgi:hypothetical protein|uniref:Anti-sigma-28 factor FlgM C-terminal domain-containing protein n=1 Tax=Candidatus Wallbacteria bacterium HGW-Wallbacteria-1 TaxID=2013854 RepID=A0A2N1PT70_9BACT|nr:MAG: hypothetical protein CVV64_07205 [Candidatus Wallbacteria bacterium HGW-Wallbacteria-1]